MVYLVSAMIGLAYNDTRNDGMVRDTQLHYDISFMTGYEPEYHKGDGERYARTLCW